MAEAADILELVPRPKPIPVPYEASSRYGAFIEDQLNSLTAGGRKPSAVEVLRTLVRVTFQYYYERQGSPLDHRDRVFEENGTLCCYGQFLLGLEQLHDLWLAVERLPVVEPVVIPEKEPEPVVQRPKSVQEAMWEAFGA